MNGFHKFVSDITFPLDPDAGDTRTYLVPVPLTTIGRNSTERIKKVVEIDNRLCAEVRDVVSGPVGSDMFSTASVDKTFPLDLEFGWRFYEGALFTRARCTRMARHPTLTFQTRDGSFAAYPSYMPKRNMELVGSEIKEQCGWVDRIMWFLESNPRLRSCINSSRSLDGTEFSDMARRLFGTTYVNIGDLKDLPEVVMYPWSWRSVELSVLREYGLFGSDENIEFTVFGDLLRASRSFRCILKPAGVLDASILQDGEDHPDIEGLLESYEHGLTLDKFRARRGAGCLYGVCGKMQLGLLTVRLPRQEDDDKEVEDEQE